MNQQYWTKKYPYEVAENLNQYGRAILNTPLDIPRAIAIGGNLIGNAAGLISDERAIRNQKFLDDYAKLQTDDTNPLSTLGNYVGATALPIVKFGRWAAGMMGPGPEMVEQLILKDANAPKYIEKQSKNKQKKILDTIKKMDAIESMKSYGNVS